LYVLKESFRLPGSVTNSGRPIADTAAPAAGGTGVERARRAYVRVSFSMKLIQFMNFMISTRGLKGPIVVLGCDR
jgi:hypothetical protein